ncbi:MAG: L-2-amino-thiazoline-4-carboxylic acid hydrolase [Candidatus Thorarchaeota archaeon]
MELIKMEKKQRNKLTALVQRIRAARNDPSKLNELIEKYVSEYGRDADQIVLDIIAEETRHAWSELAKERGSNSIDDLLDTLWKSFGTVGGEYTVRRVGGKVQIYATKCPMADTYRKLGKEEFGLMFHCSTDPHIVAGFNENMNFEISRTLMAGDEHCNHCYSLK